MEASGDSYKCSRDYAGQCSSHAYAAIGTYRSAFQRGDHAHRASDGLTDLGRDRIGGSLRQGRDAGRIPAHRGAQSRYAEVRGHLGGTSSCASLPKTSGFLRSPAEPRCGERQQKHGDQRGQSPGSTCDRDADQESDRGSGAGG